MQDISKRSKPTTQMNKVQMKILNVIQYFQFDNLVKNRVPFLLLNFSKSLEGRFTLLSKTHLQNHEVLCTPEQCLQEITHRKLPKEFPILVFSEDSSAPEKTVEILMAEGFINAYVIQPQ